MAVASKLTAPYSKAIGIEPVPLISKRLKHEHSIKNIPETEGCFFVLGFKDRSGRAGDRILGVREATFLEIYLAMKAQISAKCNLSDPLLLVVFLKIFS
jgi:hypothetical protein